MGVWPGQRGKEFVVLGLSLSTGFYGFVEFERYVLAIPRGADHSKCRWQGHRLCGINSAL